MNKPLNIVIRDTDYRFGDGKIPVKLRGLTTTDWASHFEFQVWQLLVNGDTDDCWDFGGIKGVDAFMDALIGNNVLPPAVVQQITDWGFMDTGLDGKPHFHSSPRYPGIMTGIGQNGGEADTELDFAKKNGLVPFTMLPVTQDMTIAEYFDKTAVTGAMISIAQDFLALMGGKDFILYQWVNNGGPTNLAKMAEAQPLGPFSLGIPVSSTGWNQVRPTPATGTPVHVVSGMSVDLPNSDVYISDNYAPFNKILGKGYQISYVLQIIVQYIPPPPAPTLPPTPTVPQTVSWLSQLSAWLSSILEQISPTGRARLQGASRSPKWSEVERAYKKLHPTCEVCGTKGTLTNKINIHHCVPFSQDPSKELLESNLWTLCRRDHFLFGHFLEWASWNKDVREDSALWNKKITSRP